MLEDLYQEAILDHGRRPRNFGPLEGETGSAEGYNPLCGDRVRVAVRLEGGTLREVRFQGVGCAISQASASMMTQAAAGLDAQEAIALSERFRRLLTEGGDAEGLGELECLLGVRNFPNRVKCATLAWHALTGALAGGAGLKTE
jgi:nitrogen fixation NifU-like protein